MDYRTWDLGQWLIIGLCIFLVAWYVVVSYLNRKRGIRFSRWLRDGLSEIGEISDMRWIGSSGSGGGIYLKKMKEPFQSMEAIFLLESREILPLWLFNGLRNKRDELILKASLKKPPTLEVEVAREGDRLFQRIMAHENKKVFKAVSSPDGFQAAFRGKQNPQDLPRLEKFLEQEGSKILSISVRTAAPHIILRVSLSNCLGSPAGTFFNELLSWVKSG